MRNLLMTGWSFMRILRIVLGAMLIIQSVQMNSWPAGLLGGFLMFQGITNTGCCGASGCGVHQYNNKKKGDIKSIEYEEVK